MTQSSSTQPTAFATLTLILGALILLAGLIWASAVWFRINGMNSAAGTIVQLDEYTDDSATLSYLPVVEFKTQDGATVRSKTFIYQKLVILGLEFQVDSVMSAPNQYRVGDAMTVYYNPRNPQDIQLGDVWQLWATPASICGAGLLVLALLWVFQAMTRPRAVAA